MDRNSTIIESNQLLILANYFSMKMQTFWGYHFNNVSWPYHYLCPFSHSISYSSFSSFLFSIWRIRSPYIQWFLMLLVTGIFNRRLFILMARTFPFLCLLLMYFFFLISDDFYMFSEFDILSLLVLNASIKSPYPLEIS